MQCSGRLLFCCYSFKGDDRLKCLWSSWDEITGRGYGAKRWRRARRWGFYFLLELKELLHRNTNSTLSIERDTTALNQTPPLYLGIWRFLGWHKTHFDWENMTIVCLITTLIYTFETCSRHKGTAVHSDYREILLHTLDTNHSIIPQTIFICSFVILKCVGLIWPT